MIDNIDADFGTVIDPSGVWGPHATLRIALECPVTLTNLLDKQPYFNGKTADNLGISSSDIYKYKLMSLLLVKHD